MVNHSKPHILSSIIWLHSPHSTSHIFPYYSVMLKSPFPPVSYLPPVLSLPPNSKRHQLFGFAPITFFRLTEVGTWKLQRAPVTHHQSSCSTLGFVKRRSSTTTGQVDGGWITKIPKGNCVILISLRDLVLRGKHYNNHELQWSARN